jgi:hypothetical protein
VSRVQREGELTGIADPEDVDILSQLKYPSIQFNDDSILMNGFGGMVKSRWSPMRDLKEAEEHARVRVQDGWVRYVIFVGKNIHIADDIMEDLRALQRPRFRMMV